MKRTKVVPTQYTGPKLDQNWTKIVTKTGHTSTGLYWALFGYVLHTMFKIPDIYVRNSLSEVGKAPPIFIEFVPNGLGTHLSSKSL